MESNYTPCENITLLLLGVNLKMAKVKLFATLCKLTINVAAILAQEGCSDTGVLDDAVAWWQTATRLFLIIISQ